jgi:hypothetical protein
MEPPPQKEGGEANRPAADQNSKQSRNDTDNTGKPSPQARWKAANPQAVWAEHPLRSAIKRGLIVPRPCEACGKLPTDAHHDDYGRPMEVQWLCRSCHKAEHKRRRAAA